MTKEASSRRRSGISFFGRVDKDVALHLVEAKAYTNGMVALRYRVRK